MLVAFVRRALLDASAQPVAQLLRALGWAFAIVSVIFTTRLIDAGQNPLLAPWGGYGGFAVLGIVAADLQRSCASSLARCVREAQLQGNLEALLATPAPTWLVLLGASLPEILAACLRSLVYLALAAIAFDVPVARCDLAAALLAFVLTLAAFGALNLIGGAITLALRRGDSFGAVVGGLSFLAGGVLYPREVLPSWLRAAGDLVPMTPALEALRRAILLGEGARALLPLYGRLALFTIVIAPLGALLFSAALRRARRDGSLAYL